MRAQWRSNWQKAFKQAQIDHPGDDITQRAVATREANRVFRVDEPTSYEEAMALEDFKVLDRKPVAGGKLAVVTIDGKKYSFDVPAAAAAAPEAEEKKQSGGRARGGNAAASQS